MRFQTIADGSSKSRTHALRQQSLFAEQQQGGVGEMRGEGDNDRGEKGRERERERQSDRAKE